MNSECGYYIMMERNSNNKIGNKAVNLFDYALTNINKHKEKPINSSIQIHKSLSIVAPIPTQQSASKS